MSAVKRFRRRPLEVEAIEWDGTEVAAVAIQSWVGICNFNIPGFQLKSEAGEAILWVEHSRGWVAIPVGHWVVRESDGNGFYPISPEAVAATWEPVT